MTTETGSETLTLTKDQAMVLEILRKHNGVRAVSEIINHDMKDFLAYSTVALIITKLIQMGAIVRTSKSHYKFLVGAGEYKIGANNRNPETKIEPPDTLSLDTSGIDPEIKLEIRKLYKKGFGIKRSKLAQMFDIPKVVINQLLEEGK